MHQYKLTARAVGTCFGDSCWGGFQTRPKGSGTTQSEAGSAAVSKTYVLRTFARVGVAETAAAILVDGASHSNFSLHGADTVRTTQVFQARNRGTACAA
jgi:hypothetical protein